MSESFGRELELYIRAGYPIVNIVSSEEDRAIELVESVLNGEEMRRKPRKLYIWSISRGMTDAAGKPVARDDTRALLQALAWFAQTQEPGVVLLKDFHPYVQEKTPEHPLIIRLLRDMTSGLKAALKTLIWLSPVMHIPPELGKEITVCDLPLPAEEDCRAVVERMVEQVKDNPRVVVDLDDEGKDVLVKACRGLTRSEAENALAKTIVSRRRLSGDDVAAILEEKEQILRKSGILEFTASPEAFGTVGGLGNLKTWLKRRNAAFTQKARDFGLPNPRGVLLVGVPGCGKSLCAKAVASKWKKPLLKFDLGRVFGSLVGDSEKNMRKALKTAEDVAPSILWIDELEKGLAGAGGGGDSGMASRVFGTLLTWMEEKKAPVFVVATANDVTQLLPELLRKGRFDEYFFVDLPTAVERGEILAIHLARRKRDPADYDLRAVVQATDEFNAAEIEEVVVDVLFRAFGETTRELRTEHLIVAASEMVPLSRTRAADIEALRKWAASNCRPAASAPDAVKSAGDTASQRGRILDL
jgi:ATP-dependent 26S proteasome regulatory subunit